MQLTAGHIQNQPTSHINVGKDFINFQHFTGIIFSPGTSGVGLL